MPLAKRLRKGAPIDVKGSDRRVIPVFVPHLGCPHSCAFCNQRSISGSVEAANGEKTAGIIERALAESGPGAQVAFYGGSFTAVEPALQEELLSAVLPFIERGDVCSVRVSTRPDCIDAEALSRLRRGGVGAVEIGAQSMDEDVLIRSSRGHTAEDVRKAARAIKSAGFRLVLQMMTGLPGDTREKSVRTAVELAELGPDGVRIYPTVVVRGTELERLWLSGEYKPQTPDEAAEWCADLLEVFGSYGIPVIRLGLNPSNELSGGDALAGAYHPAMGELAQGVFYLRKIEKLLENGRRGDCLRIRVPEGRASAVIGQRRRNIRELEARYGFKKVEVIEDKAARGISLIPGGRE